MREKSIEPALVFPGFHRYYFQDFFVYPNILTEHWRDLTGSEQKVLDFILRQTIGWRKQCDSIALSQFRDGVGGKSKGRGTGLSTSQIRRAIKKLEEKGFIKVHRSKTRQSTFCLVLDPTEEPNFFQKTNALDGLKDLFKNDHNSND